MLLTSGEGYYADLMERALYNNIIASPALDGRHYFYINPLMLREAKYLRESTNLPPNDGFIPNQRPEWHDCACCPPNVMRLFSSLSHYLVTQDAKGIQIHQFALANIECKLPNDQRVKLTMATEYPWQGNIKLRVVESGNLAWALSMRIPEWSHDPVLSINGEIVNDARHEKGYLVIQRVWQVEDIIELELNMEAMFVASNPRIDATRGCLAIQRGPIVYCLEDTDQEIKGRLLDVEIDNDQPLSSRWNGELLDGIMVVEATGQFVDNESWNEKLYKPTTSTVVANHRPTHLMAVPYYAWGNRVIAGMRVWIPKKSIQDGTGN